MKKIKIILSLLLVFSFIPFNNLLAAQEKAPTILSIKQNTAASIDKPIITGLSPVNSEVLIYVDGLFMGAAEMNREGGATDNFYFQIKRPLEAGPHYVQAIAKNRTSLRLSDFSNSAEFKIQELPAPTLIRPNEDTITQKVKPLIAGLARSGSKVRIFIDGRLNGETPVLEHPSGTADFAYRPFLNLSVGWHTAWAIAVSPSGKLSPVSNVLHFNIEEKFPAPTLLEPVLGAQKDSRQPYVVGLAKNDSRIRIFADHKLLAEFKVDNHPSGTANFAYRIPFSFSSGQHVIYATALDYRGKESLWSNIIYYAPARQPAISEQGVIEEDKWNEKLENRPEQVTEDLNRLLDIARFKPRSGLSVSDTWILNNILADKENFVLNSSDRRLLEDLLKRQDEDYAPEQGSAPEEAREEGTAASRDGATATLPSEIEELLSTSSIDSQASGLLDEAQDQQNKIRLNLIIFFLFLAAVIAWIFWVNRELIKEKKAAEDQGPEKK